MLTVLTVSETLNSHSVTLNLQLLLAATVTMLPSHWPVDGCFDHVTVCMFCSADQSAASFLWNKKVLLDL